MKSDAVEILFFAEIDKNLTENTGLIVKRSIGDIAGSIEAEPFGNELGNAENSVVEASAVLSGNNIGVIGSAFVRTAYNFDFNAFFGTKVLISGEILFGSDNFPDNAFVVVVNACNRSNFCGIFEIKILREGTGPHHFVVLRNLDGRCLNRAGSQIEANAYGCVCKAFIIGC